MQVSTVWTTLERMAIELLFAVESGTAGIFNIFLFNTESERQHLVWGTEMLAAEDPG